MNNETLMKNEAFKDYWLNYTFNMNDWFTNNKNHKFTSLNFYSELSSLTRHTIT